MLIHFVYLLTVITISHQNKNIKTSVSIMVYFEKWHIHIVVCS